MVESEFVGREVAVAVLAGEAVAQEDVEPREGGRRAAGTYSLSAMTLGSRISNVGLWILRSYWETTQTRSRNTALTASCQDQTDKGKYDSGRKSALSTSAWQDSRPGVTARSAASEWDYS